MNGNSHTLFRPPAEADSLIIRVADGCPWNGCTFCGMYKGVPYKFQGLEKAEREFSKHWKNRPAARRIFLADGDVMHLDFQTLEKMLISISHTFKRVGRVNVYANGASILAKTDDELRRLKELKLHTLYMGLESGDNETLRAVNKHETAEEMIEASCRAQAAGLRMSVMILIGLAGKERSLEHARATADVVNRMQPRLLSALRLIPVLGTPLHDSPVGRVPSPGGTTPAGGSGPTKFQMLTEYDAVLELRAMIQGLELEQTVFRADHSSNIVPLEGRFPKDKERLLEQLDALLVSGHLDTKSPGRLPWSL
ncbi:MAG: radical SAM protein [Kiritimatiellales bacterium]